MPYIYIISIETDTDLWLDPLREGIKDAFGQQVKRLKRKISLEKAYSAVRKQYDSSQILRQIISIPPADNAKILGLVYVDLFIPVLTFVFGEAQLGGTGALVSLHRLNNKYYGLPEDPALLTQRIVKESIHELGHTYGLLHCSRPGCVMNSSTYVEDIDQKTHEFCMHCKRQLAIAQLDIV